MYLAALEDLPVSADQCVAFEDTKNGMLAATSANLCTIITTHFFTRNHHFPKASLVIDQLGEPDRPFKLAAGNAHGAEFVTVKLMDQLLQDTHEHDVNLRVAESAASA